WLFDQHVPKERWTRIAQALRAAVEQFGLQADIQCTTDAARVLRIPGTENRKPEYDQPIPAEVIFPEDRTPPRRYQPQELEAALAKHIAQAAVAKNSVGNVISFDPKLFPPREPITGPTDLSAGFGINVEEICSAVTAIPQSQFATEGGWMTIARAL